MTATEQRNPVEALVLNFRPRFEGALIDKEVKFEPFLAAVLADASRQPKLAMAARSNPQSLMECLMVAANCGLLPGSAHQEIYLIPRDSKGGIEVGYIIDYRGLAKMAYRHHRVHSVQAFVVYEGEDFDWNPGTGMIRHVWDRTVQRTPDKLIAAWAKAVLTIPNGTHLAPDPIVVALMRDEVYEHRAKSIAWRYAENKGRKDSPWHTDEAAMWSKTAMRVLLGHGSVPRQHAIPALESYEPSERVMRAESTVRAATKTEEMLGKLGGTNEPSWAAGVLSGFVEEALAILPSVPLDDLDRFRGFYGNLMGEDADQLDKAIRERKESK